MRLAHRIPIPEACGWEGVGYELHSYATCIALCYTPTIELSHTLTVARHVVPNLGRPGTSNTLGAIPPQTQNTEALCMMVRLR